MQPLIVFRSEALKPNHKSLKKIFMQCTCKATQSIAKWRCISSSSVYPFLHACEYAGTDFPCWQGLDVPPTAMGLVEQSYGSGTLYEILKSINPCT